MTLPAPKRISLFIILTFLVVGLLFLGIGGWLGWSAWGAKASGLKVEGTVIALVEVKNQSPPSAKAQPGKPPAPAAKSYAPQIEYRVDGQAYRIQGSISSSTPAYAVGDKVTVIYPTDHPAD